jgi:ApbE superfamily uncharacterized protein (UPF0280 family)
MTKSRNVSAIFTARWPRSKTTGTRDGGTFVSKESRGVGTAAAIVVPLFIGGLAGAAAIAASGGALAAAVATTILGSATGAGLGALLVHAVAQHHAKQVEEQLAQGGLVVWVSVPDENAEQRALGRCRMRRSTHSWTVIPRQRNYM